MAKTSPPQMFDHLLEPIKGWFNISSLDKDLVPNDAGDLREGGGRAERTIELKGLAQATPLIRNLQFDIEIKPIEGSTLIVERTMPSKIDTVVNLQ